MDPLKELKGMADKNKEIKRIVEEMEYAKESLDVELPEEEISELVKYLRVETSDDPEVAKVEAANEFKLSQLKKLKRMLEIEGAAEKEYNKMLSTLRVNIEKNKEKNLSERLIEGEKMSALMDKVFANLLSGLRKK